jgi:hypothetical protein
MLNLLRYLTVRLILQLFNDDVSVVEIIQHRIYASIIKIMTRLRFVKR